MNKENSPYKVLTIAFLILAIVLPLSLYVGAYFCLCNSVEYSPTGKTRIYRMEWEAELFVPFARVEATFTGKAVGIGFLPFPRA
jgi:hypothetical protein